MTIWHIPQRHVTSWVSRPIRPSPGCNMIAVWKWRRTNCSWHYTNVLNHHEIAVNFELVFAVSLSYHGAQTILQAQDAFQPDWRPSRWIRSGRKALRPCCCDADAACDAPAHSLTPSKSCSTCIVSSGARKRCIPSSSLRSRLSTFESFPGEV